MLLLPEAIQDWLPDGHLAHFINDTVDRLELKAFHARTDEAEKNEPDLDIPAEIARREARLAAIAYARQRLEQRQREADRQRGRDADDQNTPRGKDGQPKGGRYQRDLGVPEDRAQENFTDPDSRIMKRAGGGFDAGHKLRTEAGRSAYRRRKWIAEPPNGWIRNVLGFRQFSLRGLDRVKAEWKLVCLALNLRRMASMHPASC